MNEPLGHKPLTRALGRARSSLASTLEHRPFGLGEPLPEARPLEETGALDGKRLGAHGRGAGWSRFRLRRRLGSSRAAGSRFRLRPSHRVASRGQRGRRGSCLRRRIGTRGPGNRIGAGRIPGRQSSGGGISHHGVPGYRVADEGIARERVGAHGRARARRHDRRLGSRRLTGRCRRIVGPRPPHRHRGNRRNQQQAATDDEWKT